MEEIQSTYYGAYYEPLKELEQEVLGWLSELVDGLSDRHTIATTGLLIYLSPSYLFMVWCFDQTVYQVSTRF